VKSIKLEIAKSRLELSYGFRRKHLVEQLHICEFKYLNIGIEKKMFKLFQLLYY